MSIPKPATHNVSRFTSIVLGAVMIVCLIMIGTTGFLKYEVDRAENALAAPDSALATEQDLSGKLRRSLGYGGFLGSAQAFITTHDQSALADMKGQMKASREVVDHLPEKIPTETRRDLQAMVGSFQTVLDRAERTTVDPALTFSSTDLIPLYAAIPIMDARVESAAATSRLHAQTSLQFWATMLTLLTWASLIIAAGMAVNVYLSMRDRNSAPLRALVQSIKNMARGDMRTSIWGMERQDIVGELARAIDQARYHFSQLPDVAVMSDHGPLRLRFEGNSKSMFDAMMQVFSNDSEKLREEAIMLSENIHKHEEAIKTISARVETVLTNIEKRGIDGDAQVKRAVQHISNSAEALVQTQTHAVEQLNRVLPYMQERAQGMAEIAQLTGKQVSQALHNLTQTERGLRTTADQSDTVVKKLASTADELGSRLFGAVNLLQASGKVLSETTEKTQSRLNEVLDKLGLRTGIEFAPMPVMPTVAPTATVIPLNSDQMSHILAALEKTQTKLEQRLNEHAQATQTHINLMSSMGLSAPGTANNGTAAQTLALAAQQLSDERAKFDQALNEAVGKLQGLSVKFASESSQALHQRDIATLYNHDAIDGLKADIAGFVGAIDDKLRALDDQMRATAMQTGPMFMSIAQQIGANMQTTAANTIAAVTSASQTGFDHMRDNLEAINRNIQAAASASSPLLVNLTNQLTNGFDGTTVAFNTLRQDMETLNHSLQTATAPSPLLIEMSDQIGKSFSQTAATLADLHSHMTRLGGAVDAVQKSPILLNLNERMVNGFDGTHLAIKSLHDNLQILTRLAEVAAKPSPLLVDMSTHVTHGFEQNAMALAELRDNLTRLGEAVDAAQTSPLLLGLTGQMANGFDTAAMAFDALRDDIKRMHEMAAQGLEQTLQPSPLLLQIGNEFTRGFAETNVAVEALRSELGHLAQITADMQAQALGSSELQDRWYQIAAQIEATRNDLSQIIVQQIEKLEKRVASPGAQPAQDAPMPHHQMPETQRQMEQQTLILSELVATLGTLDTHMQQLKSEMHAARALSA